ncbi:L-idonate 5-dehydrogenase [Mesobaculum littorinae]|uniref:L-idonate 5-dehydrogenase n=1 Tax=Mesobaculum littorinae TaxID=2486419 RepID=A0A438AHU2_9RHOB|nr:L-idonate 5-dehydrogenase [Mesobaculum littorinae]RVV98289.1 L-idonate 5-dehydrogenase [Mesobaculum littorinae]
MASDDTIRICRLHGRDDLRIETQSAVPPGPGQVTVAIGAGGICGSDMHYFRDGGIGTIQVREPIILGHEAAGHVVALGEGVTGLAPGDLVAVNPSHPCGTCAFCTAGMANQCPNMTFLGSAMYLPHAQGLFRDRVTVGAGQCHPLRGDVSVAEAACAEPLAVCLHAARIAGDIAGRRVLVTGAGPIGAFCTAVAAQAGAAEIVVTDLEDMPLEVARRMGATEVVNVRTDASALDRLTADKGQIDLVFECSAAAPAIAQAVACLRPRGGLIQVGSAGPTQVPLNQIVGKEIVTQGSFRFDVEFAEAVAAIGTRRIDVRPAITGTWPMEQAIDAFAAAADRRRSVKVHLTFAGA